MNGRLVFITAKNFMQQEFGLNPQVSMMPECHQCQKDGRENASQGKDSMHRPAIGLLQSHYIVLELFKLVHKITIRM